MNRASKTSNKVAPLIAQSTELNFEKQTPQMLLITISVLSSFILGVLKLLKVSIKSDMFALNINVSLHFEVTYNRITMQNIDSILSIGVGKM